MKNFEFNAEMRKDLGKGASRRLRRQEKLPAIMYGADIPAESIILEHDKIFNASAHEKFYSSILTIKIGSKKQEVIFKDIQRHPIKPRILHLDFQRIQADVELKVRVPLHFVNEAKSAGVKAGGLISHLMNEIEITCLPRFLPEYIEMDILNVQLNQTLHLSDIPLPEGVRIVALSGEHVNDLPVLNIHLMKDVVESNAAPEAGEVPASEVSDKDDSDKK